MPRAKRLQPAAEWIELSTTAADWRAADPGLLATMLGQLHLIRAFEETVLELAGEGLVHGPAHSSIGQEGGAVGSIVSLRSTDAVNGSHRGHHQFLAKAITHVTKGVLDPADLVTPEVQTVLQRTLAEILGLAQGYCGGRGGSMHLQWFEAGALGTNAIVGGGVPMAAGNAWAQKHSGTDDLTVTYFGDGAVNIGSVLESLNLTSAWRLPLCFFIENNLYAVSTSVEEATGEPRLSARALGFGIPAWRVDGMDPLAVHLAMQRAQERLRAGEGPVVIEALVYRFFHQNGPFPGSAFGYRTKEEEAAWRARDPLGRVAGRDDQARPHRRGGSRFRARAGAPGHEAGRRRARRAGPGRQARRPPHPPRTVAGPRLRRRRHPRRPVRTRRCAHGRATGLHRRAHPRQVHRRRGQGHGPAHGRGPAHRRARRGRAPAERRHQRRHQGPGEEVSRPRARHADQRERLRRARRRPRPRRPLPPGRRVHVPRLPLGRGRPGVQPDRQGPPHVRRPQPGAARAAHEGRPGLRLRLPAPHGPRGHLRDEPRLADHGRLDPVRLRGPDERGARDRATRCS